MARLKLVDDLIHEFNQRTPVRTGSLIISVFGDAISQHGNSVWLGSLINTLGSFGLNPRQIRTAVFRLVKEDWLVARQVGRRSYYGFTGSGRRHYEKAAARIYSSRRTSWDGKWTLVLPVSMSSDEKERLGKALSWLGYGTLTTGLLAHPSGDRQSLDETLMALKLADKVVVLMAGNENPASRQALKALSHHCWNLEEIAARYHQFIERFQGVYDGINQSKRLDNLQCFQIRTLLIHEYRRIHLQDADLPQELLPSAWSGTTAYQLTKNIYRAVQENATAYLMENMETVAGNLGKPVRGFYLRFDGAGV